MTKIFYYKGFIGIQSNENSDALIAKPGNGNLGCVCDASKVKISQEALDVLKTIPRGRDGLGEIDVFKSGDMITIGWIGGYLKAFKPSDIETSRDYDPNLLSADDDVEIPIEFMDFIDKI